MDLWQNRTRRKVGKPATGQGKTRYIPQHLLAIVEKLKTASPQSLLDVEDMLDK